MLFNIPMKTKRFTFFCFFFFLCCTQAGAQQLYNIFIVQEYTRKEILWDNDSLVLRKAPFYFEVHMYNMEGVFLNIASSPSYYNTPLNKNFVNPPDIGPMCQAEDLYNEDKDIIVDNEYFCYWYYDEKDSLYRFDRGALKDGNHIKASMTVEKIYDPRTETYQAIADFNTPLYLLCFNTTNKDGLCQKIIDRKKIKVIFK
jgi:hypothetical protein